MKDILIVEDGQKERERLEKLFRESGYSVASCESVSAAERYLSFEAFRLAVLDVGLSDKSGSYLFSSIKRSGKVPFIIIFTGNPSVHLRQRFLDEGAVDYIVKGSPQGQSEALLGRIQELLGKAQAQAPNGIELDDFMQRYLVENSRALFLDANNAVPECSSCHGKRFIVTFSHKPQLPPEVSGLVVCAGCGRPMDPEVK